MSETQNLPAKWHFKFNPCKRLIVSLNKNRSKVTVRGETFYRSDLGMAKSVIKRDRSAQDIQPELLPSVSVIKSVKLKDVDKLLSNHYGTRWQEIPSLTFYAGLMHIPGNDNEQEVNEVCEEAVNEEEVVDELRV